MISKHTTNIRKSIILFKNYEALENRKKQPELFLKGCVKRKDIESNESFKNILEIDKHSPDLTYNSPNIIYKNNELSQGIRDFQFFE